MLHCDKQESNMEWLCVQSMLQNVTRMRQKGDICWRHLFQDRMLATLCLHWLEAAGGKLEFLFTADNNTSTLFPKKVSSALGFSNFFTQIGFHERLPMKI